MLFPITNLTVDPLARANHTGTQTSATISDFTTAVRGVTAFPIGNLTVDPLARANHTGTQTAATISDFATAVRTNRLDQMAAPAELWRFLIPQYRHTRFPPTRRSKMNAPTCSYDAARSLIQNGDCISFISRDDSFLHNLTKKVTKSPYYHSGIAVWLSSPGGIQRLFVCEAHRSGRRLVPLSMYQKAWLDVKQCPVNFMDMETSLLTKVGQVDYGFADYILVGARILFGIQVGDDAGEICSELVQDEYAKVGFGMPPYVLSPGELHKYLSDAGVPDRVFIR